MVISHIMSNMYSIFVLPSKLVHGLLSWRGANVTSLLVLFLGCQLHSWYGFERSLTRFLPPTRPFIPLVPLNIEGSGDSTGGGTIDSLPVSIPAASTQAEEFFVHGELKVLQFNMLADGLSGQRPDLGAFSRVQPQDMTWQSRRDKLLYEVLQYDPDVITLQECDHYYDFFLPQLQSRGFDGVFAPKPASACLQYSNSSDGLAMFYRRDKLSMLSVETLTYAVSRADVSPEGDTSNIDGSHSGELRTQNQVALVAVCELLGAYSDELPPPVIIATTHLKAQKNFKGELYRRSQAAQLLSAVERCKATTESLLGRPESQDPLQRRPPKSAAVIITGDFNAAPDVKDESEYASLVYPLVKEHPLRLRSVLNDDLEELIERMKQQQQQQQQQGQQEQQEREQREREQRCSDVQIDGQNQQPGEYGAASSVSTGRGLSKTPLTSARKSKQRTVMAAVAKVMNATAQIFLNTGTSSSRDAAAELSAAPAEDEGNQDDTPPECATLSEGVDESTTSASAEERDGAGSAAEAAAAQVGLGSAFVSPVWTTWKARRKKNKSDEKIVKHCIDYIFYNTPSDGSKEGTDVGLRAVATLPMLSEEEVGDTLLPSPNYPSDHVALAAVLQIIERRQKK